MSNRKTLGQFFTNPTIADFMIKITMDDNKKTILDPALGMGAFTNIVHSRYENTLITGCEIDPTMIKNFRKSLTYSIDLIEGDYLKSELPSKFDAIICNPPYNKFQAIPERLELIQTFKEKYGIKLSGYSNYCIYFLVKSMNEMADNGCCCYIVPYEFLNTGYGKIIKQYLIDSTWLESIIKFSNTLKLFDEAITTSCILLLRKTFHSSVKFINIADIDELSDPLHLSCVNSIAYSILKPEQKWLKYFPDFTVFAISNKFIQIKEIGKVKRGIATGDNSFFSLNQEMITNFDLSQTVCMPCITKSPDIQSPILTASVFNDLVKKNKRVFLFEGEKATTTSDYNYIKKGENIGINKKYLTSHRTPWYQIENKDPAPILLSVFSREKIKIVRNEIKIKNLTSFHCLYLYNNTDSFANLLFCYLLTPTAQKILRMNKREYGEGLDKFEPNDLNNSYVLNLSILSSEDKEKVQSLYETLKENDLSVIHDLDFIFSKYV